MVDCIDLVEYVSPEQSFCLNEAKDHTYRGCLLAEQRIDPKAFLQSDCDEATLPDPTATVAVDRCGTHAPWSSTRRSC